ncbi:hypothetical protein ACWFR1_30170 [Streptomyces sp. NPDC055103]
MLVGKPGGTREPDPARGRAHHQHLARAALFLIAVAVGALGAALWLRTP